MGHLEGYHILKSYHKAWHIVSSQQMPVFIFLLIKKYQETVSIAFSLKTNGKALTQHMLPALDRLMG